MSDSKAELEKLLKAGIPIDVARAILRRWKGVPGSERELWQSLGMK